ncbi:hypothetical protein GCM10009679_57560 [Saccharothrix algeriensis]|uniref:ArsR family transcriptional regulator n=2 Tax=Catellatospora bangladeshensis TaxID=310355 RepID=A0A8J3JRB5_9ACTN|nr:hypothetical protein Cba03nite_31530 [Catellatospora bangladeshensis]
MTFGALAPASRRRVLDTLRAAGAPQDAVALAQATGLHPNTVRFHLKVLIEAGYVVESRQASGGRGRPQAVYACAAPATRDGGYALLAELLASTLDDAAGAELARAAGERWQHAARPAGVAPDAPGTLDEAAARATALFAELGFDPVRGPEPDAARIELRACPFLDVARRHPGVVCGVHLGLLRGLVEGGPAGAAPEGDGPGGGGTVADGRSGGLVGAPSAARRFVAELVPFARPGVCVAEIRQVEVEREGA